VNKNDIDEAAKEYAETKFPIENIEAEEYIHRRHIIEDFIAGAEFAQAKIDAEYVLREDVKCLIEQLILHAKMSDYFEEDSSLKNKLTQFSLKQKEHEDAQG
jgi:hypothetical protein